MAHEPDFGPLDVTDFTVGAMLRAGIAIRRSVRSAETPDWNSRHASKGHRTIALPSADSVRAAPMIIRLIEELGVDIESLIASEQSGRVH